MKQAVVAPSAKGAGVAYLWADLKGWLGNARVHVDHRSAGGSNYGGGRRCI